MTVTHISHSPYRTRRPIFLTLTSFACLLVIFSSYLHVSSAAISLQATTTANTSPSALVTPTPTTVFNLPSQSPTSTTPAGNNTNDASAALGCPPPMVHNIYNLTNLGCSGACCIPCPVSSVFYEPKKLENVYTVTSVFRFLSATACAILFICYIILPSRRQHPHLIVLLFSMLMIPWEGLGTAWLFKKEELLCKNLYEIADMNNSWFCGLQGAFLMYLVLVLLCLSFLLIANLHLLTVYRSKLIQIYLTKLMAFSFFLPLSLVVPVIVKKQIMNPGFGSICFVGPDVASAYFFFPLSIVVCIATLLHLGTIGFMIKTAIRANSTSSVGNSHSLSVGNSSSGNTNATMSSRQRRLQTARDISHLIKQQWRPGLLALFLLIVDMIYWLFYFIEAKKLESVGPNTTWFQQWVGCLAEQAIKSVKEGRLSMTNSSPAEFLAAGEIAQRTCAGISTPFVPNFAWAALSDLLPALFGFVLLFIFGSKMELWHDLREHLFGQHDKNDNKITMDNISKKNRDKIYDNKDSLSGFNNNNSSSISPAVSPVNPAATAGNPLRQERYQRNLKITTQLAHDNFYDDDFTQYDNPNSSRTNLTPTSSMPSPKTRNGGPILKNQGDYTINNNSPSNSKNVNIFASSDKMYHSETPEPWKPSAWIIGSAAQDDYTIQTAHRSMSPQLRINAHNSASPRIIAVGESLSPRSPPRKFYNSDDLTPTSSTTPPLIYNNNTPKAPSQNGRGSNNGYSTVGGQSNGVGGENSSHNKPDVNVDPRVQNYQRYQQQEPQSTSRVLSPAPSRPNKSIARIR